MTGVDLFGAALTASGKTRKPQCSMDPAAGPGSCWLWWELCPAKAWDCYARQKNELIQRHFQPHEFHAEQRQASPTAAPFLDALDRLAARRRGENAREPACVSCGRTDLDPGDWRWTSFQPRRCSCCFPKETKDD